jgi:hypothetical protein
MCMTIKLKCFRFLDQTFYLTAYKKRMPDFVVSNILSVKIIESIVIVNS